MKILLVANYLPDAQQSMQRYGDFLDRELRSRGYEVKVVRPRTLAGRLVSSRHPLSKWLGYIDKYLLFPRTLRRRSREADLIHICDHSNAPYLSHLSGKPNVITCHDVLAIRSALGHFPENRTGWSGRIQQRWILRGLRAASNVICVSQRTKDDLLQLRTDPPAFAPVIYHALNWDYRPMQREEIDERLQRAGIDPSRRYLLHVGSNQWYKNRPGVLKIFAALRRLDGWDDLMLIMAGKPWTSEMRAICAETGLESHARELVAPDNELLQALYSGAHAMLFPSLDEGFGWPILEAQACGCPVITSDQAPMTEIAGAGAILIDARNPVSAAAAIAAGLRDRDRLIEAGNRNLARFATDVVVSRYCEAYEQIFSGPRSLPGR